MRPDPATTQQHDDSRAEWLSLREPADGAARSGTLVEQLRPHLPTRGPLTIHDLGCGTGSMCRWLAPQLSGPQHWVLHDHDAGLLRWAAAHPPRGALDGAAAAIETRCHDITRLDHDELSTASCVTASALLDVLTAEELGRLVARLADVGCPVLIALSVTGDVELVPADPLDRQVADAFNRHQRRLAGKRLLLGPGAVDAAVTGLSERGFDVRVEASPWRLGPADAGVVRRWFSGWLGAACEQVPSLRGEAPGYSGRRMAQLDEGRLSVTVHHRDLLALPRHGRRGTRR